MNKSDFNKLYLKIYFLDSFDFIIQDEVISKFLALLKTIGYSNSLEEILADYKRFIEILKIKKVDDLNQVIAKLRMIPGVIDVQRSVG